MRRDLKHCVLRVVSLKFVLQVGGDGEILEGGKLEEEKKAELGTMSTARKMFQNMDVLGQTQAGGTKITTIHENQVK